MCVNKPVTTGGVGLCGLERRLAIIPPPRPGVAKPEGRQQMKRRGVRSPVCGADSNQDVLRARFSVLHRDVEVAILGEDTGIEQLIFIVLTTAALVFRDQIGVWERSLRILVERLHVGMTRRVVEEVIGFLNVLAVIALVPGQPEQAFLQYWVGLVPEP